jgi:CpeT protein
MKIILTTLLLLLNIKLIRAGEKIYDRDVSILGQWMSGTFDSKLQADTDSDYFEIHLNMKPIWKQKKDGVWLYVEQAMASALEKPYRQRVYHVYKENDSTIVSHVYTIKNPLRFAGQWKSDNPLQDLSVDSLEDRKGCSIYLTKTSDGKYVGSTKEKDCESNLRGAAYATSKVTISSGILESWDQGFDVDAKQVWGATKGGYKFVKKE